MKIYLYKYEQPGWWYGQHFVVSTIPQSRFDIKRGWGNMPKIISIVRLNQYGHQDETAPYRLRKDGPSDMEKYTFDLIDASWLDILITTGVTKAQVMEFLKKGRYVNFYSTDTV